MKIGILTYTKEYANLGTNMQCYCTLNAVRQAYPEARVELLDYAPVRPSRRPYLSNVSLDSLKNDVVRMFKYDRFFREELVFSKQALVTTQVAEALDFIKRQRYDALYVGSDTVLELKRATPENLTPYWLDTSVGGTKIFAAASSHNVTRESLSARQKCLIERTIDQFSLMGVRDEATFRLLSGFIAPGDKRLQMVPDPTFTYEIDYSHIERYLERRNLQLDGPIVCLHLLRDMPWATTLANYFRQAGYLVASLRPARYADLLFTDLSPLEQMGLYRYFALVVTHRFHDTIFCLKNLTPVMAFPEYAADVTGHGESKISTLLKAFGARETGYVPHSPTLGAEELYERHGAAIAFFHENRPRIEAVLRSHANQYHAFMKQSTALVQ